jgi:hypothetical protein
VTAYFPESKVNSNLVSYYCFLILTEVLLLGTNSISGELLSSFGNMINLGVCVESRICCPIYVPVPTFVANVHCFVLLYFTEILYLADNDLHGSIPVEMGNMTGLKEFMIFANYLTGNIPTEFSKLISLFYLDVRYNKMSGMVPYAICELREKKLESIWIDCHGGMKCACCSNCLQN